MDWQNYYNEYIPNKNSNDDNNIDKYFQKLQMSHCWRIITTETQNIIN